MTLETTASTGAGSPASPVIVHPAGPRDIPALADLIAILFGMEPDFPVDRDRQLRGLTLLVEDTDRSMVLAARSGSRVVGMVTVQLVVSTATGGWSGLLEDMIIHPDWRSRGIGASLVAEAEAWIADRGATRMQLLADRDNQAGLGFWEHQGYGETRMICRRKLFAP